MSGASPAAPDRTAGEAALLDLRDVSISFGSTRAVESAGFSVAEGEVVALVGESGSGKTVTAMSLLGLLPPNASVTGRALLAGRDLYAMSAEELRSLRGSEVGMVFQEPMSALNPVFTVGDQLVEAIRIHRPVSRAEARRRAVELLDLVGIPEPRQRFRSYPHELSGGQLQRIVIAMAVANEPRLLIADEPTTALDVTVQAEILDLLRDLRDRLGAAILLITHDMGVVADIADRVVVMYDGEVVEQGEVTGIFAAPSAEYTRGLLSSVISLGGAVTEPATDTGSRVLTVENLSVTYRSGFRSTLAAEDVNLHIDRGEVLGLVGESGSGKSTVARAVAGLLTPSSGSVHIGGTDIGTVHGRAARELRRRIGVVFQDPLSSLNPRATVSDSVAAPIRLHRTLPTSEVDGRVAELFDAVRLPATLRNRYPHELSGGQRQRVCIARALALSPELLVADEPTSALDVTIQARILDLLSELQEELRFACLFISHDLAVIERLANKVAVMRHGHIIEQGPTAQVLTTPTDPYTRRLLAAAPVADPETQRNRRQTQPA